MGAVAAGADARGAEAGDAQAAAADGKHSRPLYALYLRPHITGPVADIINAENTRWGGAHVRDAVSLSFWDVLRVAGPLPINGRE